MSGPSFAGASPAIAPPTDGDFRINQAGTTVAVEGDVAMWVTGKPMQLRVLLVEDAPFLRYAFGRLLRMQGFEVCEANDGQQALDCLVNFHPHLVLTDLMMPVMGGVELIRRLRADPKTAHLPIVAITADATEYTERQARQAGALDVITKPVDLPALIDRLRNLWA